MNSPKNKPYSRCSKVFSKELINLNNALVLKTKYQKIRPVSKIPEHLQAESMYSENVLSSQKICKTTDRILYTNRNDNVKFLALNTESFRLNLCTLTPAISNSVSITLKIVILKTKAIEMRSNLVPNQYFFSFFHCRF